MKANNEKIVRILITTSDFSVGGFSDNMKVIQNPYKRKLSEEEVTKLIEEHQPVGIIAGVEPLTREVFEKARNLKVISRCGVGVDSIDLDAAEEHNIKIVITPDAPTASVAELTLTLILALLKKITVLDKGFRNGVWKGEQGFLLSGKSVGVIGCGRIGTYAAKLLHAFGCSLFGYDPYINRHDFCKMVAKDELLMHSDIITLHIPYTKENHHIIGRKEICLMRKTAFIINTARGGLIDEEALLDALKLGNIAGAALDCFEEEPYSGELINMPNTIFTPHMGSSTFEGRKLMEEEAVKNLLKELNS